jgi:hypothetical protein
LVGRRYGGIGDGGWAPAPAPTPSPGGARWFVMVWKVQVGTVREIELWMDHKCACASGVVGASCWRELLAIGKLPSLCENSCNGIRLRLRRRASREQQRCWARQLYRRYEREWLSALGTIEIGFHHRAARTMRPCCCPCPTGHRPSAIPETRFLIGLRNSNNNPPFIITNITKQPCHPPRPPAPTGRDVGCA